jgi:hypothetical protein
VTPLELTNKLMDAAILKGAKLLHGAVEGVNIVDGKITGVRIAGIINLYPLILLILIINIPASYSADRCDCYTNLMPI